MNILTYKYLYNGGGVAVGDLNEDDRPDLYFTANQGANALYLNEGHFEFRDVTDEAGVVDAGGWSTGVTMADVNGDGRLDIYVCKSGWMDDPDERRNKLYVHQGVSDDGVPQFEEKAEEYGLDDPAHSTHATFFDYDRDGDLDLYLLNHPIDFSLGQFEIDQARETEAQMAGEKLYQNSGGHFVDVSDEAGLIGNAIGYGLSATVSDVNGDGWPDLYVANDLLEDDYLYVNQGDGTFEEKIRSWMDHTSYSSMGSDIADVTNDGRPDIFTLDMLPEGQRRQKLLKGPEGAEFYRDIRSRGYYHQYMRNMLHRNNGNGTFSEIGQLAGVSNTDWSWAPLFADFDLDGYKDLFVTNGYRRDSNNLDYLTDITSNLDFLKYHNAENPEQVDIDLYALAQQMPSTPISNYAFRNEGDLTFQDVSSDWGLNQKSFSTGAAYADLNNDGALDLVVNNVDQEAFVYRNNARSRTQNNYLRVDLEGEGDNRFGVGAKVEVHTEEGRTFYQELMPVRGFQSTIEPVLTFGIGGADVVDLVVKWPTRGRQRIDDVEANQTIVVEQEDARIAERDSERSTSLSAPVEVETLLDRVVPAERKISFDHKENKYVDFQSQPLLPHMLSRTGPALATADVTGNGREDVFVGGARGQSAALFVQRFDGTFEEVSPSVFETHRGFEDTDAVFLDVDGDGTQDLYVVSGGKAARGGSGYQDRVYLNDGAGRFTYASEALPSIESSGGAVAAHDFNGDGRTDLFVGGRVWPGEYPLPPQSHLLKNTGGQFEDVTTDIAPLLFKPGMVTDALWEDLDGDGTTELVLAGEWMSIRVFEFGDVLFEEVTGELGFEGTEGWWYRLETADLTGDGAPELIAGNRGLNAQVQARPDTPAAIYASDFSRDGSTDPIMTHPLDGEDYPVYWHDTLVEAIPPFESRFDSYEDYAESTIEDILTAEEQEEATRFEAGVFETSVFERADGRFRRRALPIEAQVAPIQGLVVQDVNGDERPDLLMAGNDFTVRPQWGRADAEKGTVLLNEGDLQFEALRSRKSGFFAPKDVRAMTILEGTPPILIVGNNDAPLSAFSWSR